MRVKEENEKVHSTFEWNSTFKKLKSWHLVPSHMANRRGKSGSSGRFYFLGLQDHCGQWLQPWNLKTLAHWEESYDKYRQCIKMQRHHFSNKSLYSECYVFLFFSSSPVWMQVLDHKGWVSKNWCFWIVVLEKFLENTLDSKEIKPVNPKWRSTVNTLWKDRCWSWPSNTLATWYEVLTHWKRSWSWERLKAKEKGGRRNWDG